MMPAIRIGLTSKALLAANAVLGLLILVQVAFPSGPAADAAEMDSDSSALLPEFGDATLNPPSMADMPDMLERPVFFVARRLPAPEETAPPPPPTPLRLKLEGIALSGGARVAVLRNLANNQLVQLEEGGTHEGWTLDALTSTSASFSRGAQVTELPLDPDAGNRR